MMREEEDEQKIKIIHSLTVSEMLTKKKSIMSSLNSMVPPELESRASVLEIVNGSEYFSL
jgi:hypothetical protein